MAAFSEETQDLRRKLAYACRILAAHGQNDTIYGHVTYRQPGADTFWMKPAAMGLDEMTVETVIRLDLDGQVVEGDLPRHVEFPIHSEIFRARPAVTCVIHISTQRLHPSPRFCIAPKRRGAYGSAGPT